MKNEIFIYSFYRFTKIEDIKFIKQALDNFLYDKLVKGTVLIANEGINGSISSSEKQLNEILSFIRKLLKIKKLNLKKNKVKFIPFNKIKVRLKKEIVSLGIKNIDVHFKNGKYVKPKDWNKVLGEKNLTLIDVRNEFEIKIGSFKNALNPHTISFRDFPKQIEKLHLNKQSKIAMYCTGGIRCEKASTYLKTRGYKNVFQLSDGIIGYLEYVKNNNAKSLWKGECFVFDGRITINKNLKKGKYYQCYGCRHPITKDDMNKDTYIKGVSCPHCYDKKTIKQVNSLTVRQKQIDSNKNVSLMKKYEKIFEINS